MVGMSDFHEDHDEGGDGEEHQELPPELQMENLRPILDQLRDCGAKIGLYDPMVMVGVDPTGDEIGDHHHQLMVTFVLGDHAFSKAVQAPEADKIDLEVKKFEAGMLDDEIESIRNAHRRKPEGS